jgi:outer membrane murein-binding lipoprotein Lpp
MVSTYAEESRLSGEIEAQIFRAEKLDHDMAAADRELVARQERLYSGDDAVYREAPGAARQDIASASERVDSWNGEIDRMEKECYDLRSRVARLPPGEQGQAAERLEDLRRIHVVAGSRLIIIQDRIIDLLDRVLYITERH